jgi:hypothetical protein
MQLAVYIRTVIGTSYSTINNGRRTMVNSAISYGWPWALLRYFNRLTTEQYLVFWYFLPKNFTSIEKSGNTIKLQKARVAQLAHVA